jgi:membrane protein YdbS with pleckstrin-like domain
LKTVLTAARALLLLTLLFLPSIGVLMVVAFLSGSTRWFLFVGTPVVLTNAIVLLVNPVRHKLWRWAGGVTARRP